MIRGVAFRPGDVYSFRTSPFTKYSDADTGRYAALKVLAVDELVTFVVLNGVFERPPDLDQVSRLLVLHIERFSFVRQPALHYVSIGWRVDLDEFRKLGNIEATQAEISLIPRLRGGGLWSVASSDAEGEWRWHHDREKVYAELERVRADQEVQRLAEEHRYAAYLEHLTWTKLLEAIPFAHWETSSPFPPQEFTSAARERIRDTILRLHAASPKPKKRDVRAILRSCVEWFNETDERFGQIIETEEREGICKFLSEIAFCAHHPSLAREVDQWRKW